MSDTRPTRGIDPRGPRFAAAITSLLLLVDVFLGLTGLATLRGTDPDVPRGEVVDSTVWAIQYAAPLERAAAPAFVLLAVIALLFLWGALWPRTAPWGALYRSAVQPRIAPSPDLEDPRPPRFAQAVGLVVTGAGLVLHLAGVPWALPIAAGAAFVAAALNAVFGLCLGCQLYLLLQRAGVLGRAATA